jgi:hypothetical protein
MKSHNHEIYLKELQQVIQVSTPLILENTNLIKYLDNVYKCGATPKARADIRKHLSVTFGNFKYEVVHQFIRRSESIDPEDIRHNLLVKACLIALKLQEPNLDKTKFCLWLHVLEPESFIDDDCFRVACAARFKLAGILLHKNLDMGRRKYRYWFYPSDVDPSYIKGLLNDF